MRNFVREGAMRSLKMLSFVWLLVLTQVLFAADCLNSPPEHQDWCRERQERQRSYDHYFASNKKGGESLITRASGTGPVPMVFFRLFTELFPEIWGTESDNYSLIGLTKNNNDHKNPLPMGMAYSETEERIWALGGRQVKINNAGFNCVACHSGQYLDADRQLHHIIGAPSTRADNLFFIFAKTSRHENFNGKAFRAALRSKPDGWIYNDPKMLQTEREERNLLMQPLVAEELIASIKLRSEIIFGGFSILKKFTYSAANAPDPFAVKRGSMDGLIPTLLGFIASFRNPLDFFRIKNGLPRASAEVDPNSIWNQRDRGGSHWDGAQPIHLHRNIGAASTVNLSVNVETVVELGKFIDDLPSPAYPFDIDMQSARRGEKHFQNYCMRCHGGQNKVFDFQETGTDPNRYFHFTEAIIPFQGAALARMCNDEKLCSKKDGTPYSENELAIETIGYVGGRLDGIWARAPYLHNGSVPTLHALLTNIRPVSFFRGNLNYDQEKVGFQWKKPTSGTVLYDTRQDGNSNTGHDDINHLGKNWNHSPKDLADILAYLKTL